MKLRDPNCLSTLLVAASLLVACSSSSSGGGASASASGAAKTAPSASGAKPAPSASAAAKPAADAPSAQASATTPPASSEKPVGDHKDDPVLTEAKNTLGAISRAAQQAYAREPSAADIIPDGAIGSNFTHALCKSAKPVPEKLPSGGEKIPVTKEDFGGDETTGWKCLKFELVDPTPFRYTYAAGSGYLSPSRGGVDPGPDGFEACAEADLTAGGLTTLVCITGKVDKEKSTLKVATEIFQADE